MYTLNHFQMLINIQINGIIVIVVIIIIIIIIIIIVIAIIIILLLLLQLVVVVLVVVVFHKHIYKYLLLDNFSYTIGWYTKLLLISFSIFASKVLKMSNFLSRDER